MQNITFFPTTLSNGNIIIDRSTLEKLNFTTTDKVICFVNPDNELVIKNQAASLDMFEAHNPITIK